MEYEVRFYYSTEKLNDLISKLENISELKKELRTYEKTIQFNHCDERYNFYSKGIDGRFRYRISSNDNQSKTKLSWKKRLNNTSESNVNKEEEVEVHIDFNEKDNFLYIVENVMNFKVVESYERYRTAFKNNEVEISIDEYPFGIALEIESIESNDKSEDIVIYWCDRLELDINKSYRLSWDDKYEELCKEQGKTIYSEVTFDKDMPSIKD